MAEGRAPSGVGSATERWDKIWATRELLLKVAWMRGAGHDAEDIAQEAMARAVEHPEVEDQGLQAWLLAVTTRLCIDTHRRRVNERVRWQRMSGQAGIVQPGQNIEEEACARSEAEWVANLATELLPERQVRALELAAEGLNVRQVATTLGVPYGAAESLLARARRTIRAAIGAGLGAAVWAWRSHLSPMPTNPVSVALVSVTATVVVGVIPAVLLLPHGDHATAPAPALSVPRPVPAADTPRGAPPAGAGPAAVPTAPRRLEPTVTPSPAEPVHPAPESPGRRAHGTPARNQLPPDHAHPGGSGHQPPGRHAVGRPDRPTQAREPRPAAAASGVSATEHRRAPSTPAARPDAGCGPCAQVPHPHR